MNVEEALDIANRLAQEKTGEPLSKVHQVIFQGAWQGKTYEEVAEDSEYQLNYIKQDAGPKLWKLLSDALGERIGKKDLPGTFLQAALEQLKELDLEDDKPMKKLPAKICNRDVHILIDQSGSMTKRDAEGRMRRWDSLREQVMSNVDSILSYENAGEKICEYVRIFLFSRNRVKDEKFKVENVTHVDNIFLENRPDSTTFIKPTLEDCIKEWFQKSNKDRQGAFFIIYTDGQFDDTEAFEELVSSTCRQLNDQSLVKIIIIGVGKEIDEEYFEKLDNNAKGNLDVNGNPCDIVVFDLASRIDDILNLLEREL